MKYKQFQSLYRKSCVVVVGFVTAGTLTACSFSFQGHGPIKSNNTASEFTPTTEEVIAVKIDNTDLTNEDETTALVGAINDVSTELIENHAGLEEFVSASLVRVVDGDTIVVEISGDEYKVRMIGIDTPESVASDEYLERTGKANTDEGVYASDYTKNLLSDYDTIYLAQDISDTDRYGRLLRYVWLEVPEDAYNLTEISTKMVNGILLKRRIAELASYEPDTEYESYFKEIAK